MHDQFSGDQWKREMKGWVKLSVGRFVLHEFCITLGGIVHDNCAVKARGFEPWTSSYTGHDCAIEARQLAGSFEPQTCSKLSQIVSNFMREYWVLVRSIVLYWLLDFSIIIYTIAAGFSAIGFPIHSELMCDWFDVRLLLLFPHVTINCRWDYVLCMKFEIDV